MIPIRIDADAVLLMKEKKRDTLTIDVRKSGGG